MAIFKYTLPSGSTYTVETPTGYTQAQADYLFYSQVASGSLVGYAKGQSLSSLQTQITKFELSRLDRGTAGVDSLTVLAINDGSPVAYVPNLSGIALKNPITVADYAQTGPVNPVGPLSPEETQALVTQIANLVDQPADVVSTDKGVGTYGLGPDQLENAGYLKPGTSNYPDFNCVVGTPSVWTGKNGVYSLADVTGDPALQTQIQTAVMNNGYDALVAGGTIQTPPSSPASITTGQVYTSAGVLATLTAPALVTGTAALTTNLNSLVTTAFAGAGTISSLLSNPVTSLETIASGAVSSITQSATGIVNGLTNSAASAVTNLASNITNQANGAIGALVTNASQYGSVVTAAWAQGSSALGTAVGSLNSASSAISSLTGGSSAVTNALGSVGGLLGDAQGLANGVLSSATGVVSGALGSLTELASGALGSLQGQAQALLASLGGSLDIFGKMSQFSIDFSLFSSDSLVSATKVAAGFSNTVNRQTVDAAVNRILGNAKIPAPSFEFPSVGSSAIAADIKYAQQQLQTLASSATGLYNNATGLINTATSAGRNLIG
jgi:hypothetical protein